jgi:hypothetical protein
MACDPQSTAGGTGVDRFDARACATTHTSATSRKTSPGGFMLKQLFPGTIAALALMSTPLLAKDAPAPPSAPPELAQVAFFEGTWNCTGKTFANPMGPEHATEGSVHGVKGVGGMWMHINYDEKKTAANPMPYHVDVHMGFDAGTKKFVEVCVDNFGGYCTQSGSGWSGDMMKFEGTANGTGKAVGVRDTFTKKGTDQVTHTGEMQGDDKQWIKTDEETCHKGK